MTANYFCGTSETCGVMTDGGKINFIYISRFLIFIFFFSFHQIHSKSHLKEVSFSLQGFSFCPPPPCRNASGHGSFDPWVMFWITFWDSFFGWIFNCQKLISRHLKPQRRFYNCKYFKKNAILFKDFYTHIVGFSIMAFSSVYMASKTHNSNFITETINSTYEVM